MDNRKPKNPFYQQGYLKDEKDLKTQRQNTDNPTEELKRKIEKRNTLNKTKEIKHDNKEKGNLLNKLKKENIKTTEESKRNIEQDEIKRPIYPNKTKNKDFNAELQLFEKINKKITSYLKPNLSNISEDEQKKKIGIVITTLIIFVLIVSCYYFLIYEPSQKSLNEAKTEKLNELHSLYKGPLASAPETFTLEQQIKKAKNPIEVEAINIIGPATKDWKNFQKRSIDKNHDEFNRTMAVYETDDNKSIIMPISEAINIVDNSNVEVLSNINFKVPDTISVPILISRLQAGAGLVSVGSVVDIYTQNNINETTISENETAPTLSGCTVLSIMRCEESGEIESEYGTSKTLINGNSTQPHENTKTFTANVIEMIKGSLAGGYNEKQTIQMLENYGVRLANCEREINLAELDTQYLLLIEVPHDKVNYVINNMDNLILTMPTKNAPEWMVSEISSTCKK